MTVSHNPFLSLCSSSFPFPLSLPPLLLPLPFNPLPQSRQYSSFSRRLLIILIILVHRHTFARVICLWTFCVQGVCVCSSSLYLQNNCLACSTQPASNDNLAALNEISTPPWADALPTELQKQFSWLPSDLSGLKFNMNTETSVSREEQLNSRSHSWRGGQKVTSAAPWRVGVVFQEHHAVTVVEVPLITPHAHGK